MPGLKNDCFALPPGVHWTPVDEALARLREATTVVVEAEELAIDRAAGRVLAEDVLARRANPPGANSAVDGYGFAHAGLPEGDEISLPLMSGRAAAGASVAARVPAGQAVRILTGALLPDGVDTVILQEDVSLEDGHVRFGRGLKPGANCRAMGEDLEAGMPALPRGRRLAPQDLALLSAVGIAQARVFAPLKVGVLSTGDEVVAPGSRAERHQIFDANRPMLLDLLGRFGMEPVDLGHAGDRRDAVRTALDQGGARCDAILTSGGASAGDEDHISALLEAEGTVSTWRIGVKPGRPLALGQWRGRPIFGLPGNPVAAFVCALVFARPALGQMAGEAWHVPQGFILPAAFSKSKKAGRREFLRARVTPEGGAEVFASEGSGRISGLSWADGLVELPDEAMEITPGAPVRYIPYSSFF